jgi:hypothetical protein
MPMRPPPESPAPNTDPKAGPNKQPSVGPEQAKRPREIGGPKGPEPTRYGDWERNGRCIDF